MRLPQTGIPYRIRSVGHFGKHHWGNRVRARVLSYNRSQSPAV
jgi:hypothetical protein